MFLKNIFFICLKKFKQKNVVFNNLQKYYI